MQYQAKGKVIEHIEAKTFQSGKTLHGFVIETDDDKYPQKIKFDVWNADVQIPGRGALVKVAFDIRGREHNGNYYVGLSAWRIDAEDMTQPPVQPPPGNDDIPF